MARIDNLGADDSTHKRVRGLERATPLPNSSITRGRLRVASAEGLVVEGSAKVSGTLDVTGVENVTGTLNVYGPLLVDGPTGINGTLGVNGPTNVTGNLEVLSGGTIRVGGLILDPNVEGFGGIRSIGTIYLSGPGVVTPGQVTAGAVLIVGSELSVTSLPTTTNAPNLYVDSTGKFFKCV